METMERVIKRIMEKPSKIPSKQEAARVLRSCGIFDAQNNLNPVFREIFVQKQPTENADK